MLYFGIFEQTLYDYIDAGRLAKIGKDEKSFIYELLTSAGDSVHYSENTGTLSSQASRLKRGQIRVPEVFVVSFRSDGAEDHVREYMAKNVIPHIQPGKCEELTRSLCDLVRGDDSIDKSYKAATLALVEKDDVSREELALFLARLLIYAVGVEPPDLDVRPLDTYNLPHSNDWFTDREAEITKIEAGFDVPRDTQVIQILYGMGGMGKTQTALEYVYKHYSSYSMIHWINAESMNSIVSSYKEFLKAKKQIKGSPADDEICRLYIDYLESHRNWLIVYDNCCYYTSEEFNTFRRQCLPSNNAPGHILFTTRSKQPQAKANRIEIGPLGKKDAAAFLQQRAETKDEAAAEKLAHRLGCFPLALEIAGAYIRATPGCSISDYLRYLAEGTGILDEKVEIIDYSHTVKEVLQLTFERIAKDHGSDKLSQSVEEIVRLCSFGAPYDIDLQVLGMIDCEHDNTVEDSEQSNTEQSISEARARISSVVNYCKEERNLNKVKQLLVKYALADEQENGLLSMHELEQEIIRDNTDCAVYYSEMMFRANSSFIVKPDASISEKTHSEAHIFHYYRNLLLKKRTQAGSSTTHLPHPNMRPLMIIPRPTETFITS